MMSEPNDFLFEFGPIFIGIIFVIVFLVIIASLFNGVSTWNKNNNSPRLTVRSKVISKRTSVHGGGETRAYSHYFITFEMESGDRMELQVEGKEFGLLAEGDHGELSFQGTRYLGFTRTVKNEVN